MPTSSRRTPPAATPPADPSPPAPRRHRATWVPFAVAAVVAALAIAAVLTVPTLGRSRTHPSPYGAGWTIALWQKSPRATVLRTYLLDPDGHRNAIDRIPYGTDASVLGWSGDRKLAAVMFNTPTRLQVRIYDLVNRTVKSIDVSASADPLGFDGQSLVVGAGDRIHEYNERGKLVADRAGPAALPAVSTSSDAGTVTVTGGTSFTITPTHGAKRHVARPSGTSHCTVRKRWTGDTVLAVCDHGDADGLWAVPVDGGKPTRVARPAAAFTDGALSSGFVDAWPVNGHVYVREQSPSCVPDVHLAESNPDGDTTAVSVPVANPRLAGVTSSEFFLRSAPAGCLPGPSVLYRWNPTQSRPTAMLGGPVNGGSVADAVTLG